MTINDASGGSAFIVVMSIFAAAVVFYTTANVAIRRTIGTPALPQIWPLVMAAIGGSIFFYCGNYLFVQVGNLGYIFLISLFIMLIAFLRSWSKKELSRNR